MIAILVALLLVQDANPPPETATIRGRVVGADGRAIAAVQLRALLLPNLAIASATTDEDGRYELVASIGRPVRVSATKTGYTTAEYGEPQPFTSGEEMALKPGEIREHVDFTLLRHSAIAGRVLDENADPVEGVVVSVQQGRFVNGHRQLAQVPRVASRRTNELGTYRIWGLLPGEYFVSATVGQVGSDDLPDYGVTYFPGTPNPSEATRVHVGGSQDIANVDFSLARVKPATIRGTTLTSSGDPYQGGVRMRPSRRRGIVAGFVGARTFPDGRFEFPNVAPGDYVIEAFKGNEFGWRGVTVNGDDVSNVDVQTL